MKKPDTFEFIMTGCHFMIEATVTFGCDCNYPSEAHPHVESIESYTVIAESDEKDVSDLYEEDEIAEILSQELARKE